MALIQFLNTCSDPFDFSEITHMLQFLAQRGTAHTLWVTHLDMFTANINQNLCLSDYLYVCNFFFPSFIVSLHRTFHIFRLSFKTVLDPGHLVHQTPQETLTGTMITPAESVELTTAGQ